MVAKKSGSLTATRSTGICSRANQTRMAAGMRSSVRIDWNIIATISIVARSTGVVAACLSACLRCCSSASICGVLIGSASGRSVRGARRCCTLTWALLIASASTGDTGFICAVSPKPGNCLPTSRFRRLRISPEFSRRSAPVRVIKRVSSPTAGRRPPRAATQAAAHRGR